MDTPKIIGVTGGIGSGKSTICNCLQVMGYPVFNADNEAKKFYQKADFILKITQRWGQKILTSKGVDFSAIAQIVFNNSDELTWINQQIHPFVQQQFNIWLSEQKSSIVFKEAAILFESGAYTSCNAVISVVAPESERIARVMQRDGTTLASVQSRLNKQYTDAQRAAKSTYLIHNHNCLILPQIYQIIQQLLTNITLQ